jgi:hypothetical protein
LPALKPGAKHGKTGDRDQPEQGPEVGPQEFGPSGHVPTTAILLARRHDFLSEWNVCRSTDFDVWMRRDIQVGRAMTSADFAADRFCTPERNLTVTKAIGMPTPDRAPQAMVSQAFAMKEHLSTVELQVAACLKVARRLPQPQANMTLRPMCRQW